MIVLEYVFEGHRRGYNFTTPMNGYDEETTRTIWRHAMARGNGWGEYVGARAIKAFPLPDGRVAVSEMTVTDLTDESGRRGIRRAVIDVMKPTIYQLHLQSRLAGYPAAIRKEAGSKLAIVQQRANRLKKTIPLLLNAPYTTPREWWLMEALILMLVMQPKGALRRRGDFLSFTTLALDYRSESTIVALPEGREADIPMTNVMKSKT